MKSLIQCRKEYKTTTNYYELMLKYFAYCSIDNHEFGLEFKANNYTTERYMIMCSESENKNNRGWIVVYDFKSIKGSFVMFNDTTNNKQSSMIFDIRSMTMNNHLYITADISNITHNDNYPEFDDEFASQYVDYITYFAIIKDGDDETVYSQLYGSLMKCAIDLKLQKILYFLL